MTEPKQFRLGYAVVTAASPEELSMKVQTMLSHGFRPLGGIGTSGQPGILGAGGLMLYQAMFFEQEIIDEEKKEPSGLHLA